MPVLDGIEATRRIVADPATAGVRVLILTTFDLDEYVYAALAAGASGFLLKDATPEEIVHAIRVVAAGESLLAPDRHPRLVREFARRPTAGRPRSDLLASLTEREIEVLLLVAQGLSNAEIAERLVVSPATAKTHVSRILTKLGLRDRAQLVVAAYEAGLVVPGSPDAALRAYLPRGMPRPCDVGTGASPRPTLAGLPALRTSSSRESRGETTEEPHGRHRVPRPDQALRLGHRR